VKPKASSADAIESLRSRRSLSDMRIDGRLELRDLAVGDHVEQAIRIRDCDLEVIAGSFLHFEAMVELLDCRIRSANFFSACFLGGLALRNCRFTGDVDFQCGGHNRNGSAFVFDRSEFGGFVNFFDCWFEGPVLILASRFSKGTNLLGNIGQPFAVRFDVLPEIRETAGELARDGKGDP
jgi:hypothetical protein